MWRVTYRNSTIQHYEKLNHMRKLQFIVKEFKLMCFGFFFLFVFFRDFFVFDFFFHFYYNTVYNIELQCNDLYYLGYRAVIFKKKPLFFFIIKEILLNVWLFQLLKTWCFANVSVLTLCYLNVWTSDSDLFPKIHIIMNFIFL